jgi:hypothetical protein
LICKAKSTYASSTNDQLTAAEDAITALSAAIVRAKASA